MKWVFCFILLVIPIPIFSQPRFERITIIPQYGRGNYRLFHESSADRASFTSFQVSLCGENKLAKLQGCVGRYHSVEEGYDAWDSLHSSHYKNVSDLYFFSLSTDMYYHKYFSVKLGIVWLYSFEEDLISKIFCYGLNLGLIHKLSISLERLNEPMIMKGLYEVNSVGLNYHFFNSIDHIKLGYYWRKTELNSLRNGLYFSTDFKIYKSIGFGIQFQYLADLGKVSFRSGLSFTLQPK